ncbi:RNA-directed DNA polymerase [Vagococcus xieshaowenii]|uniref:RNA-directed DNA polymerase n=1 Tax=Vagococcus xieshaowenii TaxID=2562451 RepID=UPI00143255CB|nr:RNA-directed DNA polymerase [Vagococcus xieshaowenii]
MKEGAYQHGGYRTFVVTDSKRRVISASTFVDRLVNYALCQRYIIPYTEPFLLPHTAACRRRRGTSYARRNLRQFIHQLSSHDKATCYVLRVDIRHFYDSIPHARLKQFIASAPYPEEVKGLCYQIIESYHASPGKGLPLGNQTSQWWANATLHSLDTLIVQQLGHRFYARYMDDLVLLHPDKQALQVTRQHIIQHLWELGLAYHPRKTQLFPLKNGVEWLGWRYQLTANQGCYHVLPQRIKRRLRLKFKHQPLANEHVTTYRHYLQTGKAYFFSKRYLPSSSRSFNEGL